MSTFEFLVDLVDDLVDLDDDITEETLLESIGLVSLDYIEVQVRIKKEYGVVLNPELFISGEIKSFGDLISFIDKEHSSAAEAVEA